MLLQLVIPLSAVNVELFSTRSANSKILNKSQVNHQTQQLTTTATMPINQSVL
jgi:hypothetical protein